MPPAATVGISVAGPAAIAVLWPRSRVRDVAMYALQMWGFVMAHELPYDNPEALRRRLRIDYPIRADKLIGETSHARAWHDRGNKVDHATGKDKRTLVDVIPSGFLLAHEP